MKVIPIKTVLIWSKKIDNIDENISKTNDSNGNPDLDDLHPLGDDEHFEIPAFLRKNKK